MSDRVVAASTSSRGVRGEQGGGSEAAFLEYRRRPTRQEPPKDHEGEGMATRRPTAKCTRTAGRGQRSGPGGPTQQGSSGSAGFTQRCAHPQEGVDKSVGVTVHPPRDKHAHGAVAASPPGATGEVQRERGCKPPARIWEQPKRRRRRGLHARPEGGRHGAAGKPPM